MKSCGGQARKGMLGSGLGLVFLDMIVFLAYFSPSWTAFQADRGRHFSGIVDGVSA
jgi:hypothetical protein